MMDYVKRPNSASSVYGDCSYQYIGGYGTKVVSVPNIVTEDEENNILCEYSDCTN